ncbi:hypothetical protein [Mucilaginibacter sp. KACC 22063]|uniref:hypothetical protein n=1 Tax=Mucilaginibacter sp. KACC 22063 TaxID=3025666 RepID=UPI00236622C0|nr:hypothetical protein [Mucilaginibacter sp. KACC 22063]WDF55064.1 hypothetical protein PQ461_19225 [Mucilaginibacter sp. KACC 22063]
MFKRSFIALAAMATMASCHHENKKYLHADTSNVSKDTLIGANQLIVPGKSIGKTYINENVDSVMDQLGKPQQSDAAMGAAMNTWMHKTDTATYQTDIYSHRNFGGKDESTSRVKIIRVTSPWFKTVERIHNGSLLDSITKYYQARYTANYANGTDTLQIYDDIPQGIAFEVKQNKCAAILVHIPKDSSASYISMHPKMQFNRPK